MATDISRGLRTTEEYVRNIAFSYMPVSNEINLKEKHDATSDVQVNFRQLDVDKDNIIAENLTAGQTEYAHIKAHENVKKFGKLVKGAKIIQSVRSFDFNRIPDVVSKIIRQYSVIYDKQVLFGADGNAGVWGTTDPLAITNESATITTSADPLATANAVIKVLSGLKRQVSAYTASRDVLIYVFGAQLNDLLDSVLYNGQSIRRAIGEMWAGARFVEVPELVAQGTKALGFSVISQGLVALNYTKVPELTSTGYNEENKYFWGDFEFGSTMVDVREYGALINQPVTVSAGD